LNPLAQQIALHYELCDRASARSFASYLDSVVIDSVPPRRFASLREPWQTERYDRFADALSYVSGHSDSYDGPLNFWLGYSKGHDKTTGIGRVVNWLLAYAKRRLRGFACAADSDQDRLLSEAMVREAGLNPWLKKRLRIQQKWGYGASGSSIQILAADAASAHGILPDFLILDEITHWESKDFFDAIYSSRDKRPRCLTFVLTNAGVRGSWQHQLRNLSAASPHWNFYEQPQGVQLASWMDAAAIAESRKMLTLSEARRLHDNVWVDPGEDCGFVSLAEAEACEDETLPLVAVGGAGRRYWAGVDYGEKKDRTALSVLHLEADGVVRVDRLDVWAGSPTAPVPIEAVERWMEEQQKRYRGIEFVVDPYQMVSSIQKLEARGVPVHRWESRGGKKNYELAQNLRTLILSRRIRWPRGCGALALPTGLPLSDPSSLTSELGDLITRAMSYGYRFDHEGGGHDDRAVSVGMAALFAVAAPPLSLPTPTPILTPQKTLPQLNWAAKRGLYGVAR